MSLTRIECADELERLAIRAADRSDGLVDLGGVDAALFLFAVARVLRDAEEVIRMGPDRATANVAAALKDADASTARRRDEAEAEAAETARKDTEALLAMPDAIAVLNPKGRIRAGAFAGFVYAGKVLRGADGVEGLSVSVLLPMPAASEFPVGGRAQLSRLSLVTE